MKPLSCLFGHHNDIRRWTPGHVRLMCLECGRETPGLRGPVAHVEPPVVKVRRAKRAKVAKPALVVVKRKTA
jgi:hypothetical protein